MKEQFLARSRGLLGPNRVLRAPSAGRQALGPWPILALPRAWLDKVSLVKCKESYRNFEFILMVCAEFRGPD